MVGRIRKNPKTPEMGAFLWKCRSPWRSLPQQLSRNTRRQRFLHSAVAVDKPPRASRILSRASKHSTWISSGQQAPSENKPQRPQNKKYKLQATRPWLPLSPRPSPRQSTCQHSKDIFDGSIVITRKPRWLWRQSEKKPTHRIRRLRCVELRGPGRKQSIGPLHQKRPRHPMGANGFPNRQVPQQVRR